MAEPRAIQVMREFKRALTQREQAQMVRMGARWREVERSLELRMQALAEDLAGRREAGQVVGALQLPQMERYQTLLRQVREEIAWYEGWATRDITAEQLELAELGIESAQAGIRAVGVGARFDLLPVQAVEFMVGSAADGAPLFSVLQKRALWPEAVDGLTSALVKGTALGWNPRKTALRMADGLAQGFDKALTIARCEQLRVYRHANVEQYRESGVVKAFRRLSAKSKRTCVACLMKDGELIPLDEDMYDHVAGRCSTVPVLIDGPEVQWETGREWFEKLDPDSQREIMGDKLFKLWDGGKGFDLADVVKITENPTWGKSLGIRPLKDLGPAVKPPAPTPPAPPKVTGAQARQQIDDLLATDTKEIDVMRAERRKLNKVFGEAAKDYGWRSAEADKVGDQINELNEKIAARYRTQSQRVRDAVLFVDKPVSMTADWRSKVFRGERRATVERALENVCKMVSRPDYEGVAVRVFPTRKQRSFCGGWRNVYLNKRAGERTVAHELGHVLEHQSDEVRRAAREFLDRRTQGETAKWLGDRYERNEIAKVDKFIHPYMGKQYSWDSTEIVSMGVEYFYSDPLELAQKDPEYFDFIFGLLRGL